MGAVWWIYCPDHDEELVLWGGSLGAGEGALSPDLIDGLKSELEDRPAKDPYERELDKRFFILVSAFVERHRGCGLRLCSDYSAECSEESNQRSNGRMCLDMYDDIIIKKYWLLSLIESTSRDLEETRQAIRRIEVALQGKMGRWRRRKLHEELTRRREGLHNFSRQLRRWKERAGWDKSQEEAHRRELLEEEEKYIAECRSKISLIEDQLRKPSVKFMRRRKLKKELDAQRGVLDISKKIAEVYTREPLDLLEFMRANPLGESKRNLGDS